MTSSVVVVDYGIGNVFSVCNALKKIGAQPVLTRDPVAIRRAERLILPGVGAFGRAMDALHEFGIDNMLTDYVATERPLLGICLGMQMLMDVSTEFGDHKGLGFIAGRVEKISSIAADGRQLRVPHIGWATVERSAEISDNDWNRSAVSDERGQGGCFYFVHSFMAKPLRAENLLADVEYGGNLITAAIMRNNIMGVQFHPERSGPAGLAFLHRFVDGD